MQPRPRLPVALWAADKSADSWRQAYGFAGRGLLRDRHAGARRPDSFTCRRKACTAFPARFSVGTNLEPAYHESLFVRPVARDEILLGSGPTREDPAGGKSL